MIELLKRKIYREKYVENIFFFLQEVAVVKIKVEDPRENTSYTFSPNRDRPVKRPFSDIAA